eukprot:SAG22_NODE_5401_length_1021_cov_1.229935_3_plen_93_part_01
MRFRVWNTSSFVILTAAYSIQPYFVAIYSMAFMIFCVRPGALLLLATAGLLGAAAGCSACCVPRPPTSLCMQAAAAAAAEKTGDWVAMIVPGS